ncbi:hypothetical protein C8Q70DRAFT_1049831 [Cubamyces menziesii]|uniref:3-carboxymuconate cyclase n=1 Tax=Trametes cubensis TaxID=1111947 RepID=A0AAD7X9Z3_9APHY|nr:hypothetical protein C8Q70DRAFT_1049831 [Cubamyces menziesii]KAJ8473749.1 hypothetical protein ONZ51_g7669 [Trametes cubensis]
MRFASTILAFVLSATSLVCAGVIERRGLVKMMTASSLRRPAGAVYFITNEPQENMVITASIDTDGTLRLDRAVAAGGRGLHGVTANGNMGVDGLFSQGSVQVSQKANVLAVVNPGSNTISLFSIDPSKPTNISPLGDPVSSEGEFPVSLAFNADGSRLCALNGGAINGVNCFSIDKKLGLVPVPNSLRYLGYNQTTPANGPPGSLSQIIFSEDGSKLLASYKGTATAPGYLVSWDVQKDGSLSAQHSQVAVAQGGMDVVDLSGKGRDAAVTLNGQMATCWSTYSPKTGNYYAIDVGGNVIREVHLDGNLKGSVVATHSVPAGTSPIDSAVATIRGKDYLYVLGANATSVEVFALSAPGQAKQISKVDISGPAHFAQIPVHAANLQGMATYMTN